MVEDTWAPKVDAGQPAIFIDFEDFYDMMIGFYEQWSVFFLALLLISLI
jgi:hypothetical protein